MPKNWDFDIWKTSTCWKLGLSQQNGKLFKIWEPQMNFIQEKYMTCGFNLRILKNDEFRLGKVMSESAWVILFVGKSAL